MSTWTVTHPRTKPWGVYCERTSFIICCCPKLYRDNWSRFLRHNNGVCMFVRFGCVLGWIWLFMTCMGKQMLYLGKALIGKFPNVQRIFLYHTCVNKALLQDMSLSPSPQSPTRLQTHKEWMAAICASSLLICRSEITPSQMRRLAPFKFVIFCWWNQEKND